jgi:uncharacterized protein (TIGR01777 family)
MTTERFVRRSRIEAPAEDVFRWHARPGALTRLTPPWTNVEEIARTGGIENGARTVLRMKIGPAYVRWVAEHYDYIDGRQFRDRQIAGPFAYWDHTHRIEPDGPTACTIEDSIEYALPAGRAGALLGGPFVRRMLDRMFAYRHRITAHDLATHAAYTGPPLHVLVSGSTGLIGSALVPFLTTGGHRVTRIVRGAVRQGEAAVQWNPATGELDTGDVQPVDAVVHLAGENIAGARWSTAIKARIKESRGTATRQLCESLARLEPRPKVLICASAIGYYGDRGAEVLTDDSASGTGFLAEVCRAWETATAPAANSGIRVVNLRFGVVLSAAGGALATMLLPFQFGAGGTIGGGEQYMSWIALDEVPGVTLHALLRDTVRGALNVVTPQPVTNREYTKTLGRVLKRPTLLAVPTAAARLAFGEMADEMLLASTRVEPARLLATHYRFGFPELEPALRHTLGR